VRLQNGKRLERRFVVRGYVDTSCGQIHYQRAGESGPHVILLHCANFSSNLYERTLPFLGERMQAWAFDAPGVGMSDAPPEPSMTQIATWLLEALDGLGIVRPVAAGLHTGSRIALQMVQIAGDGLLAGAVLSGVGPLSEEHRELHPIRATTLLLEPDKEGTQWMRAIERYREIYPDEDPPTEENGWLQHLYALSSLSKVVPMRMPWPGRPPWGVGLERVFRDLAVPILLLNTPEDVFAPIDEELATWNPRAELKLVTGIGAHFMLRAPERYADEVVAFMERHALLGA
jgi:pimeloyl-ACP methyl ester carboxylesterase